MAPEVVTGDRPYDHRADLYALGCVAYWLLAGRFVFQGANSLIVMMRHLEAQPEPPSRYAAYDVPPELDEVVLDCLAKSPDDRPADAEELARRLAACPVPELWTAERARAWWQAHLSDDHGSQLIERQERARILH
jgi:serine/threonine protein kinase